MPFSDEDLSDVSEDWDSSGDEAVEKKEKEEQKLKAMEEASKKSFLNSFYFWKF